MINKSLRAVSVILLASSLLFSGQKIREKDLSPRFQEWLKLVSYIIQPEERDVFFQLAND